MSGEYFELQIDDNIDEYSLQKLKKKNMKYGYLVNKCASLNVRSQPTLAKFCNKKNPVKVLNQNNEIKKIICDNGISLQLQMFDSKDQIAHKTQMYIDSQEQQLLQKYGIRCLLPTISSKHNVVNDHGEQTKNDQTEITLLTMSQGYAQDEEICVQIQQQLIEWFNKKRTTEQTKLIKPCSDIQKNTKKTVSEDQDLNSEQLNNSQDQFIQRNTQKFISTKSRNISRNILSKGKRNQDAGMKTHDHIYDINKSIKEKNMDQNDLFSDPVYNNQLNANQRIYGFGGLSAEEIKYRFSMKRLDMLKRNIKAQYNNQTPFNNFRCIFLQLINEILQYKNQQIQLLLIKGNQTAYYQKLDSVWPELITNLNYQFDTQLPKSFPYFKKRYTILPRVPVDDPFIKEKVYNDATTLQNNLTNAFQADIDNFIIEMASSGQLDTKKQYGFRILEYFQQIKPQLPNALNNQQGFVHAHVSQRQSEQLTQDDVKRYLICYAEVLFFMQNQQFLEFLSNDSKNNFETKKDQLRHQFSQENVVQLSFFLAQYLEQLFYGPLQNILKQLKNTKLENKALQQNIRRQMKQSQDEFMMNKCEGLVQHIIMFWDKIRSEACQNADYITKQNRSNVNKRDSISIQQSNNQDSNVSIANFSAQGTTNLADIMKMYQGEDKYNNIVDLKSIIEGVSVAAIKANEEKYPYLINSQLGRQYESTFLDFVYEILDIDGQSI